VITGIGDNPKASFRVTHGKGSRQIGLRWFRFNLVGGLGVAVQLAVLLGLKSGFHLSYLPATALAVEVAVLHNFFWHERFTWRDRGSRGLSQRAARLWRFHVANGLVSLAGNTALIYLLVHQLKMPALPSAVAAIALCSPLNFLLADRWVYRQAPAYACPLKIFSNRRLTSAR